MIVQWIIGLLIDLLILTMGLFRIIAHQQKWEYNSCLYRMVNDNWMIKNTVYQQEWTIK